MLGKQFMNLHKGKNVPAIVIGVMDDLPQRSLAEERGPQVLVCLAAIGCQRIICTSSGCERPHADWRCAPANKPEVVIPGDS